jgi:hypothetical protein
MFACSIRSAAAFTNKGMLIILLNTLFFADVPEKSYASATSIANTAQPFFSAAVIIMLVNHDSA